MHKAARRKVAAFHKDEKGFTLIDVSIALMVIGLLVAPMMHTYHRYKIDEIRVSTNAATQTASQAINNYYNQNDRYPCPADRTLGPADTTYGEELRDFGGTDQCLTASLAVAAGTGGVNVFIGMLPFKSLKLTPKEAIDAWDNKLLYAVTDPLTNVPTGAGAITIQEDFQIQPADLLNALANPDADQICTDTTLMVIPNVLPALVYTPVTNVHYVVMSHGENGFGAYYQTNSAAPIQVCPAVGATLDEENCNDDAIFKYNTCLGETATGVGNATFDDYFAEGNINFIQAPFFMWDNGTDPNNTGSSAGYIGIGNVDPQAALDVIGDIRAQRDPTDPTKLGQAHASDYCDTAGSNCFSAQVITGTDPNMRCSNGEGMSGIDTNAATCSSALPTPAAAATCPAGQYISAITATGAITCATP